MKRLSTSVLAFLVLALAVTNTCAQRITATVKITNIPNVVGAFDNVQMFYDYGAGKLRFNYNLGPQGKPIEIFDFQEEVRYLGCGATISCDAETYKVPGPVFHKLPTDITPTTATCGTQAFSRNPVYSTDVKYIAFNGNNVCRAVLGNGKTYDFSNVAVPSTFPATTFDISTWNCPKKVCNKQMDIMLVLDVSSSVGQDWGTEKEFAVNFAKSFTIGPSNVQMGLVTFDQASKLEFGLLNDKNSVVNGINKAVLRAGWTCMGCGLRKARETLDSQARNGVQRVIVFLSDGQNNRPECGSNCNNDPNYLPNAKTFANRSPGKPFIVSIGVTNQVIESEMMGIASGTNGYLNGVKTYFSTPSFTGLSDILEGLIDATCLDLPGNPCGTGCRGFCSCDSTCVCPDSCDSGDKCQIGTCTSGINGNGCLTKLVDCNDNDACTTDTCNSTTGCAHKSITCPPKKCFNAVCDKSAGCIYTAQACTGDGDPCKNWYCDSVDGQCKFTPRQCDVCKERGVNKTTCSVGKSKCEDWNCKENGIEAECFLYGTRSCEDNNACTTDSCDAATGECVHQYIDCDDGNSCTHDYCDPLTGCFHTDLNVSAECNDGTVCTNEFCNPDKGCDSTPVVCEDFNPCTENVCNSILGCTYPPVDCAAIPAFANMIGDCYMALCNDGNNTLPEGVERPAGLGCFLYNIPGTKVSSCGTCGGDEAACFLGIGAEAAAGIGAGILAVIIASVAAAFLIVGGVAGKKGLDAYRKNKREMWNAQNNALYQDSGRSGNNPFYESAN